MRQDIQIPLRSDRPHSRNVMPSGYQKSIGPFLYFDHLGPYDFPKQHPVFIAPHPHAGITTVSYLLAGEGHHKDSLGNDLVLDSGRLNWMNAGNGIIHSEGTSKSFSERGGGKLLGFQIWIMGTIEERKASPTFQTFSKEELPIIKTDRVHINLLAGEYLNQQSPIQTERDLVLFVIKLSRGQITLSLQKEWEYLIYSLEGSFQAKDKKYKTGEGMVLSNWTDPNISSEEAYLLVAGGPAMDEKPVFQGSLVAASLDELNSFRKNLATNSLGKL